MTSGHLRRIEIIIEEAFAEQIEDLHQRIIESNTGSDAIDNGQVKDFAESDLLSCIFKIGLKELKTGDYDVEYYEPENKWIIVKPFVNTKTKEEI